RVFGELKIALAQEKPSLFFDVLTKVGGLLPHFQELYESKEWTHSMTVLDHAAELSRDPVVRYSALVHDLEVPLVKKLGARLKLPTEWTMAAVTVSRHHPDVQRIEEMEAENIVEMFYEIDAFRRPWSIAVLARVSGAAGFV